MRSKILGEEIMVPCWRAVTGGVCRQVEFQKELNFTMVISLPCLIWKTVLVRGASWPWSRTAAHAELEAGSCTPFGFFRWRIAL